MKTEPCYDGDPATEGKGLCKGGTRTCKTDGSGFGPCDGEVVPAPENCVAMMDQDCNGTAAQCTGIQNWTKRFGNGSNQRVSDVARDGAGNTLVTGAVTGMIDFGGGTLPMAGAARSGKIRYQWQPPLQSRTSATTVRWGPP